MKSASPAPIRPTLASFLAAFGPAKGPRLWAFLAVLSLIGRDKLQGMGITRTAVFKNLRELTTHPALSGMKLLGHHVRGRAAGELVRDLVADLVEATYEGHLPYREFLALREVLHEQADGLEEIFRARAARGPLTVTLEPPKLARKPKASKSSAPKPRSPLPAAAVLPAVTAPSPVKRQQKKKKVDRYVSSGYCELCTHMWPDDWKPTLTGRGMFRCLGCKQELDIGLRMEPTRSTMKPIPRPASYRREDLEKPKAVPVAPRK